jgi:uncharacterized metal-binding protein YceD (DUF177 family)
MSDPQRIARIVDVNSVGEDGTERYLEWSAEERQALAKEFGVLGIESLSADLVVVPWQGDGFAVTGRIKAAITQSCVVSLVPVEQKIDEPFEVHFVPQGSRLAAPVAHDRDVVVQVSEDEPPEVFTGKSIDLGPVVTEHFALAIDPYPRAPGAELPTDLGAGQANQSESPFAVLAKLKKQGG